MRRSEVERAYAEGSYAASKPAGHHSTTASGGSGTAHFSMATPEPSEQSQNQSQPLLTSVAQRVTSMVPTFARDSMQSNQLPTPIPLQPSGALRFQFLQRRVGQMTYPVLPWFSKRRDQRNWKTQHSYPRLRCLRLADSALVGHQSGTLE